MPRSLFLFFICCVCSTNYLLAQITFEPGYIIDNSGTKTECQIRFVEWRNNPERFEYKIGDKGQVIEGSIANVREFVVRNMAKYERHSLQIERSTSDIEELERSARPEFEVDTLYLQVLVEGRATLYAYRESELERFFFIVDSAELEQLVYKVYTLDGVHIRENQMFKQQLKNTFKCDGFNVAKVEDIEYKKKDLIKTFEQFNECSGVDQSAFGGMKKSDHINLTVRPGINLSDLVLIDDGKNSTKQYNADITVRLGLEAEFVLPFNRNKWSLITEPTIQYYSTEVFDDNLDKSYGAKLNYVSLEIPLGFGYYMYLNESSKVFVNAQFIVDIPFKKQIRVSPFQNRQVSTRINYAFGVGFKPKERFSVELRYLTGRDLLSSYQELTTKYRTLSLIFGYSFL